jgi:aspartate carbamoyltransferase catalytic subunit
MSYYFAHKHIISIEDLSRKDIEFIIQTATSFKEISTRSIKKVPTLRGKTIINFFFEPSTRTRMSFEIAAKRMSADTFNISASGSSAVKGETLIDTVRNLRAMNPDAIIIRHQSSGVPDMLRNNIDTSIINAGDGIHEHPSQALLDMMTIMEHKSQIEGLKVAIIGDIAHSRVAHSNIIALLKCGAEVSLGGPATFMPAGINSMNVKVCRTVEEAISDADVIMTLRIQQERQRDPLLPSLREYANFFGINARRLKAARPDVLIMHPGPVNRGVELAPDVADGPFSVILDQVTNGVAIRMALLYLVIGGGEK